MNTNRPRSSPFLIMVIASVLGSLPSMNQAEVTLDGTLGPSGALPGPNFLISEDLGQIRGGNLFHSFGFFNINTGESATFTGPSNIENILGRVTGGRQSFINGPLRSQIPGANLYLMNPSGLFFGPNSSLDVSGSFYVTTADYIGLGDGGRFSASNVANSVLTMAPPTAFGFLGDSPAAIAMVQSQLEVPKGERLTIVGGQTVIAGSTLAAASGQIDIASVSSPGEVMPMDSGLQMRGVENQGSIYLFGGSSVSATGPSSGQIVIRGGRFEVDDAALESNATTAGQGGGVDIQVNEGDVIVTNDGSIKTDTFGTASGLELKVDAQNIVLSGGGFIAARARGGRRGGDTNLTAHESVSISGIGPSGFASGILTGSLDAGDGGRLIISTPELIVSNDGEIRSFSALSGRGSDVVLNVDKLTLEQGGNIDVSSFSDGSGGNLDISAEDTIRIAGSQTFPSGLYLFANGQGDGERLVLTTNGLLSVADGGVIFSASTESATGGGADLDINVNRLEITDGGFIGANTFGAGKGGNLSITVEDLRIIGGRDAERGGASINSTTSGSGQGGNINITASQQITLDGQSGPLGASIASDSLAAGTGTGTAGHITLTTPVLRLLRHATISGSTAGAGAAGDIYLIVGGLEVSGGLVDTSTFGAGQAGNISVAATDSLALAGTPDGATPVDQIGQISSFTGSSGNAGAITIFAPALLVDRGGRISTQVSQGASGAGGRVRIESDQVRLMNGGFVSAASFGSGDGGGIMIKASDTIQVAGKDGTDAILVLAGGEAAGAGDAGSISLETNRLDITDGAVINSSTRGAGQGGNISIHVGDLDVNDNAAIAAVSTGTGLAGNVTVHAKDAVRLENGIVITGAIQSDGGNIVFDVRDILYLLDGKIIASVAGGAGNGGNITIDPQFVILNRSEITANAFGGNGGNILIVADNFLASSDSNIAASSRFGLAGQVVIQSPEDDAIARVAVLPASFLDAAAQLSERCIARTDAKISSFVLVGRGSIPVTPNSVQLSSYIDVQNAKPRNDSYEEEVLQQSQLPLRSGNEIGTWSAPSLLLLECGRPSIRKRSDGT